MKTLSTDLVNRILDYVDARVDELRAKNSSDHGMAEKMIAWEIRDKIKALLEKAEQE